MASLKPSCTISSAVRGGGPGTLSVQGGPTKGTGTHSGGGVGQGESGVQVSSDWHSLSFTVEAGE